MRRIFEINVILVALLLGTTGYAAVKTEIVEYGYYRPLSALEKERNFSTTTGYTKRGNSVKLVEQTYNIPLQVGQLFGFKFKISHLTQNQIELTLKVSHPKITRPNGTVSEGYTYPMLLEVNNGMVEDYTGYNIDHDYELVAGKWTFEYYYNNEKMFFVEFNAFIPENTTPSSEQVDSTIPATEVPPK